MSVGLSFQVLISLTKQIEVDGKHLTAPAWYYPNPSAKYVALKDHVAFYASKMEACYVGAEKVAPQEGDFYGGWVTQNISGGKKGMKGGPGTWGYVELPFLPRRSRLIAFTDGNWYIDEMTLVVVGLDFVGCIYMKLRTVPTMASRTESA